MTDTPAPTDRTRLGPRLGAGDDGFTDLLGPGRVPKYDLRVHTYGELDEASSTLGLARALSTQQRVKTIVRQIQHDLYLMMAEVATPGTQIEKLPYRVTPEQVAWLDSTIQALEDEVTMPRQFILPGASAGSGALDVARTVVRRAERAAVQLAASGEMPPGQVLKYLNRCSSLLFVLARYEESASGIAYDIAKR
ncbi:MAG TPA: cob(I)yrinic acid a,c-diamide adenosyltransferase [Chloroflexia bacterium]|nr:cob(I)yrinic acid a,c-diamide adenosyltransferase [Chloroflexia bacterium]